MDGMTAKERKAAYMKRYRQEHAEQVKAWRRKYYLAHYEEQYRKHKKDALARMAQNRDAAVALQAYREALGLLQKEVAARAGISAQKVSLWETGRQAYDPEFIRRIPGFEGFGL